MTVSPFSNTALLENPAVVIIAVQNDLVRGNETQIVDELLTRVQQESIALDLSNVERIDAAGIAALITLYCSAVQAGTDFSVAAPSAHVLELLRLVGLESILIAEARPRGTQRHRLTRMNRPAA